MLYSYSHLKILQEFLVGTFFLVYASQSVKEYNLKKMRAGKNLSNNTQATYGLLPEIEVLSDNSGFDLVLTRGVAPALLMRYPALVLVPSVLWHVIISFLSLSLFCFLSNIWFSPFSNLCCCYLTQTAFGCIFPEQFKFLTLETMFT